jgi:hypothetical protein
MIIKLPSTQPYRQNVILSNETIPLNVMHILLDLDSQSEPERQETKTI